MTKQMTFATAVKEHLMLPGEGAGQIIQEMKKLTDQDKEDLKAEFLKIGVEIVTAK